MADSLDIDMNEVKTYLTYTAIAFYAIIVAAVLTSLLVCVCCAGLWRGCVASLRTPLRRNECGSRCGSSTDLENFAGSAHFSTNSVRGRHAPSRDEQEMTVWRSDV